MADYPLHSQYILVKQACSSDFKSSHAGKMIFDLAHVSLKFLTTQCHQIELVSRVPGKHYFTFKKDLVLARPANAALFTNDPVIFRRLWKEWLNGSITKENFGKMSYTAALSPCLAMELFDRQNKKGPATYFECYIGHLFAKAVAVNPTKQVRLPVQGRSVRMTMDFLLDIGQHFKKVHLPVKMSTRERVVQAWAHQRL